MGIDKHSQRRFMQLSPLPESKAATENEGMKRTGQGLMPVLVAAAWPAGRSAGGQVIFASGSKPSGVSGTRQ
jgi:hypothetical protein